MKNSMQRARPRANFESGLEERLPELSEFFFVPYHFQKKCFLFVKLPNT